MRRKTPESPSQLHPSGMGPDSGFGSHLKRQAQLQPEVIALRFLPHRDKPPLTLTYQELDTRVRAVAAVLQARLGNKAPGQRALLLYDCGLDYVIAFFACLYSGVIPVPAYPPDLSRLKRMLPRLLAICRDCRPGAVLTSSDLLRKLQLLMIQEPGLLIKRWIATDTIDAEEARNFLSIPIAADSPAFLQYTSGSTGNPNGVIVTHANLNHNCESMVRTARIGNDSHIFSWLPLYHDMGLIGMMLTPIYRGIPCTFTSPLSFLERPGLWLRSISKYRATHSGGPNFAYELSAAKSTAREMADLDLSCWKVAVCGAEPVKPESLRRFAEVFRPARFSQDALFPTYGLAEATLMVTAAFTLPDAQESPDGPDENRKFISCGFPAAEDVEIQIVNPDTRVCVESGRIGEIWVRSPSVAAGYWGKNELSESVFRVRKAGSGERYLRTGDLGFTKDGQLYVTGRLKDVIVINGANHFPADIEATVGSNHPQIRPGCSAAFMSLRHDRNILVVASELKQKNLPEAEISAIRRQVERAIQEHHGLALGDFVALEKGSLPKTTSGKIQRLEARKLYNEGKLKSWSFLNSLKSRGSSQPATPLIKVGARHEAWLFERLSQLTGSEIVSSASEATFSALGLDSVRAISLAQEISERIGLEFSPTLFWQYTTPRALAAYLEGNIRETPEIRTDAADRSSTAPVAIIGVAAKFPGSTDVREFWRHLVEGRDLVGDVPAGRWNWDDFSPEVRRHLDGTSYLRGGYVEGVDHFDHAFFGISPREAAAMDPQQRWLLENVWSALEDSGQNPKSLAGSKTGVFVGASSHDYGDRLTRSESLDFYATTGNTASLLSNRISFLLDLHGPSQTIDTACSSSLVATFEAMESIRRGDCDLALAAGVNAILSPWLTYLFSKSGMLSPNGRCHSFDRRANGYVRGEGCGVVVLKSLKAAIRDRDPIYAVLRGGAVNHGGRTNSLTAPSAPAQSALIRSALRSCDVDPSSISYIEAHGTGTSLGDPIEVEGLKRVFPRAKDGKPYCRIGSVKTNVGHLEAAAGIAGLIKVVLSLHHRQLPAMLHQETESPYLKLEGSALSLMRQAEPWIVGRHPRRAGVSSFGFGGANAHLILEEWIRPAEPPPSRATEIVVLSSRSEEGLRHQAERLERWMNGDECRTTRLMDIAWTLQSGREGFAHRLAILASSPRELKAALEAYRCGARHDNLFVSGSANGEALRTPVDPQSQEYARRLFSQGMWARLASLWVAGFPVDWERLSSRTDARRVSLPTYAFVPTSHWLPAPQDVAPVRALHPLVDENRSDVEGLKYVKRLRPDAFYLRDHVVQGHRVLPAAAYLELGHAIGELACGGRKVTTLENILWARPLMAGDEEIETHYDVSSEGPHLRFKVRTSSGTHASGEIGFAPLPSLPRIDPKAVITRFSRVSEQPEIYDLFRTLGFHYGATFRAMRRLWGAEQEALALLEIDDEQARGFSLPPSLFDAALGACVGIDELSRNQKRETFIPVALETLHLFRPVPRRVYAWATLQCAEDAQASFKKYDVLILDEAGESVANLQGVMVRAVSLSSRPDVVEIKPELSLWEEHWTRASLPPAIPIAISDLGDNAVHEAEAVWESSPDNAHFLWRPRGVQPLVGAAHALYHSWLAQEKRIPTRMVLAVESYSRLWTEAAAVAAYARSVAETGTAFHLVVVLGDLPADSAMLASLFQMAPGSVWRYHDGEWQCPAFTAHALRGTAPWVRKGGHYLITGGLGGIGRVLGRKLSRAGAKLTIVGRSPLDDRAREELETWRGAGAACVEYLAGDVAIENDVRRMRKAWEERGPLHGVFHCAGRAPTHLAHETDAALLDDVLAPKTEGTRLLDEATSDQPLDGFVLFSSSSAILGDFGAGAYSAANRYQDAFAEYRERLRREGKRSGQSLSVNWPLWAEGGMELPEPLRNAYGLRSGFLPLPTEIALDTLMGLLDGECSRVFVGYGDTRKIRARLPGAGGNAVSSTIDGQATIAALAQLLGGILGIRPESLQPNREFTEYGADSVSMIEFLNLLQVKYGSVVTATTVFQHPTLEKLATFLDGTVKAPEPAPATVRKPSPRQTDGPTSLSEVQRAAWFLWKLSPESFAYNIPMGLHFPEGIDEAAARRANEYLLKHQEVLALSFPAAEGFPVAEAQGCESFLFTSETANATESPSHWMSRRAKEPFNLERDPLWRCHLRTDGARGAWILLNTHHIVFDGLSCQIALSQWLEAYRALRAGKTPELPQTRAYREFVEGQQSLIESEAGKAQLAYWKERLAGELPVIDLPTDRPRPARQTFRGASHTVEWDADLLRSLAALAKEKRTTLYTVLLSGFFAWLHRYTQQEDLILGTPMLGRTRPGFEKTVGYFVNMAPIREQVSSTEPFSDLLARVSQRVREALAHQDYPFPELVSHLAVPRDPSRSPVFSLAFVFQNMFDSLEEMAKAHGCHYIHVPQQEGQLDMELELFEKRGSIRAHWKYNADLFDSSTIEGMAQQFEHLLRSLVSSPESAVGHLPWISDEERERLFRYGNNTDRAWEDSRPLPIRIAEICRESGSRPALEFRGEIWTYARFDAEVNRLARALQARGVGPESLVGIALERSFELLTAIHAVWRAGGAYVPLDPHLPESRLQFLLEDAGPAFVITVDAFRGRFPAAAPLLVLDEQEAAWRHESSEAVPCPAGPANLAYVLYTSGSTGQPKGVAIEHAGIANRIRWMQETYRLTPADVVLQKTPFTFDVSLWELLWPFLAGTKLVIAEPGTHGDVEALQSIIRERSVTTLHFVPSMLHAFLSQPWGEGQSTLRQVFCSGEALSSELVKSFYAAFPSARLHNLYGPTEASVDVSYWACDAERDRQVVPIGHPISNCHMHVLDDNLEPVPLGVSGELYLSGIGLARGYWKRPALTAERFLPNPFAQANNVRIYRTGDRARKRIDGAVEYLGRTDAQVKIRGVRIEPGEIEAGLALHPAVDRVAVIAWGETPEARRLVGYWTPKAGADAEAAELKGFLGTRLPDFLIPSVFVRLDSIPLSASGKLDRKRLPPPEFPPSQRDTAAATELEQKVLAIFREVLGERLAVDTSFFEAGGNSLLSIKVARKVKDSLGITLPVVALFQFPSARSLAGAITTHAWRGAEPLPDLAEEKAKALSHTAALEFMPAPFQAPQRLLLTGATGFFGAYLLRECLRQTEAAIVCLVRARTKEEGKQRLRNNWAKYGLQHREFATRVEVALGDVGSDRLGLHLAEYDRLSAEIDTVLHNAARVNFIEPYSALRGTNVRGTEQILQFCATGRAKSLGYVSTISVFSTKHGSAEAWIGESDPLPERGLYSAYAATKWVAEHLVSDARERGLSAVIFRTGTLAGDSVTGATNVDELISKFLTGALSLGAFPDLDRWVELLPVDWAAQSLIRLLHSPSNAVFHLVQPQPLPLDRLRSLFSELGFALGVEPLEKWTAKLADAPDNPLFALLPLFTEKIPGVGVSEIELSQRSPRFDVANTIAELAGRAAPVIDSRLLSRYLKFLTAHAPRFHAHYRVRT